jgi:hypothetical protein
MKKTQENRMNFHRKLKSFVSLKDYTMKDYLISLVNNDMKKEIVKSKKDKDIYWDDLNEETKNAVLNGEYEEAKSIGDIWK